MNRLFAGQPSREGLDKLIKELQTLLSEREQVPIIVRTGIREIWLYTNSGDTELRLTYLGRINLTVSRVQFVRQQQGTMTAVADILESFCRAEGIFKMVVQSVQTPAMAAWCLKNGYQLNENTAFPLPEDNSVYGGDYIKNMADLAI